MLTIVTPTYNRPAFLRRLLRYYRDTGLKAALLIADSSQQAQREENRRTIAEVAGSLAVRHAEHPADIPYVQKVLQSLTMVATPLMALGSDDDFFVPRTLEDAGAFLLAHPDYEVAHGDAVGFELDPQGDAHGPVVRAAPYPQHSIEDGTASERLGRHLAAYAPTWYSVQRTASLQRRYPLVQAIGADYKFLELLPACLSVIEGKFKRLDGLYMARQGHSVKDYSHTAPAYKETGWSVNYGYFIDTLSAALAKADGLQPAAAAAVAASAFEVYLRPYEAQHQRQLEQQRPRGPFERLLTRLSVSRPGRALRRAMAPAAPGPAHVPQEASLLARLLDPSHAHHASFAPIHRALTARG